MRIPMTASQKAITRKWIQSDPPATAQWLDIVKESKQIKSLSMCFNSLALAILKKNQILISYKVVGVSLELQVPVK